LKNISERILGIFKRSKTFKTRGELKKLLTAEKVRKLEILIGCKIKNEQFFIRALVHRSFLENNSDYEYSNERLEFLGDAVLSVVVAKYLYQKFPSENEGFLTKVRSKYVNKIALAEAAESINLANFLLLGKNLPSHFVQNSKTIIADAFEALIGAIYLDNGLSSASNFITSVLIEPFTRAGIHLIDENFKSQLLEFTQAKKMDTPQYTVIKEEGPHHDKLFTVKVNIGKDEYGIGKGKSKKNAEQNAAEIAFQKLSAEDSQSITEDGNH